MASADLITDAKRVTRDKNGLCLLSLDGGGVRGLSALLILKGIMQQVNAKRNAEGLPHVRPCDVFDLIGGTSTGGLIAIMLGRLQMDIEQCIDAYSTLSRKIFTKKSLPVDWRGHVKGRYDASKLEDAVKNIIKESGSQEDSASPEKVCLNDGKDRGSRVFVCAVRKETKAVVRLRTYESHTALIQEGGMIWEAARATSAASGFFDPINIGKHGQEYVDAGLGCNNPVDEVWIEAQNIWSPKGEDLAALVKCFISIGTGNPGISPIKDSALKIFTKTLVEIATQTEQTAKNFANSQRGLFLQDRYFRFNVDQGLQSVGLEEHEKEKTIVSATSDYMESQNMQRQTQVCSDALKTKEFWKGNTTDLGRRILVLQQQHQTEFQLVFSLIAAPEIDYFVGRASDLSSIESVLLPFTTPKRKIAVLHGLGGMGKSQLAIEFAKRHRSDYTAVFWLNAKTEDTLKRSFAASAGQLPKECFSQGLLDGPRNEETLGTILQQTKAWLGLPGNDRWLLIYDNVDNPKIPDNKRESAYDIGPYFPEAHQGSILVTTRWETLRIGYPIRVTKLSKNEERISLLIRLAGEAIREDPDIGELVTKLDGLPLALATAGLYLGLTEISVSEYLGHYEESWLSLQQTSPTPLSYVDRTIYSTWNLSHICIREEDQSAAKLLELWAYFDNRDIWYELLKAGEDNAPSWFHDVIGTRLHFNSAIGKLKKHGLVERLTGSDGYSMHHCVHAWVTNVLCKVFDHQNARLAVQCIFKSIPFVPAPGDWITRQRLLSHAERCLHRVHPGKDEGNNSKQVGLYIFDLIDGLATLYYKLGKLTNAESMLEHLLAEKETAIGKESSSTLMTVCNLGNIYFDQGRLAKAESMYQRALAGEEKALGKDHMSTLTIINNLGNVYSHQGKLAEAELMYQRALVGREKTLGKDHTSTLETVNNLGNVYTNQGKLADAELMYQRALVGREKTLGKDHMSTLDTVNNLGALYYKQGKLADAESMFQRALVGTEKTLGKDHISRLDTINNLGNVYSDQGKLTEAESMYQCALTGCTRNLQANPMSRLRLFFNMGLLYRDLQDFEKAKGFFREAYEGRQSLLGPQHADTIAALKLLNEEIQRSTLQAENTGGQK